MGWESDFDRMLTTPPEPKVFTECEHCGGEIYEGEEVAKANFAYVHLDCLNEYAVAVLEWYEVTAEHVE